jgi:hypothetical protein
MGSPPDALVGLSSRPQLSYINWRDSLPSSGYRKSRGRLVPGALQLQMATTVSGSACIGTAPLAIQESPLDMPKITFTPYGLLS